MDFQKFVDGFHPMTCVMSVENLGNGKWGEIRIVCGNKAYVDSIENMPDVPQAFLKKFIPNSKYQDYFPQDPNFELFLYGSAVQKKPMHSYVHPERFDFWFNLFSMPLDADDGKLCYCTYTQELTHEVDSERMSNISHDTATEVLNTCSYRFGEPVTLLGVEGNGQWAHVRLCNGWDRYVHMDYVGPMSLVKAKQKNTSGFMIALDRIYDDVERLMGSMYPNNPGGKAPAQAQRTASCKALVQRLNDVNINLANSSAAVNAKNEIRSLIQRMGNLVRYLENWDKGGEEKYTPYFLEEFMPEYDRIGDLYR